MFDVGFWELALISIVALVIIGPERLPGAARTAGVWIGRARAILRDVRADVARELKAHEIEGLDDLQESVQSAGQNVGQNFDATRNPSSRKHSAKTTTQKSRAKKRVAKKAAANKVTAKNRVVKKAIVNKAAAKKTAATAKKSRVKSTRA